MPIKRPLLVFLIAGVLVLSMQNPDGAIAGDPIGGRFVISAEVEVEVSPAVAYNSQNQEYLVVFWNDRPGNDDIRAERISKDGKRLGGTWVAAGQGADRRYPDVAYNSRDNQYLVVWVEEDVSGYSYVRAQRLLANGQLEGPVITVVAGFVGVHMPTNPAVAYAYTAEKYLIVWEYEVNVPPAPVTTSIVGQILSNSGALESSFNVSVDPGGAPRQQPDVAYNRHANGYLVVWQQWDPSTSFWDIYSLLVDGDGPPPDFSPTQISVYAVSNTAPAVAAIPTSPTPDKFLVVWEFRSSPSDKDIHGRLVGEDGTPTSGTIPISTSGEDQSSPAVAGSEGNQQYLVVWRHPLGVVDVPIYGRAISSGGSLVGQEAVFPGPATDRPAVASGAMGSFLVAWQDQAISATNTDIYGQLWGNRVYLPSILKKR